MFMKNTVLNAVTVVLIGLQAPSFGSQQRPSQPKDRWEREELLDFFRTFIAATDRAFTENPGLTADDAFNRLCLQPEEKMIQVFVDSELNYDVKLNIAHKFAIGNYKAAGKSLKTLFEHEQSPFKDPNLNERLASLIRNKSSYNQIGNAFASLFIN